MITTSPLWINIAVGFSSIPRPPSRNTAFWPKLKTSNYRVSHYVYNIPHFCGFYINSLEECDAQNAKNNMAMLRQPPHLYSSLLQITPGILAWHQSFKCPVLCNVIIYTVSHPTRPHPLEQYQNYSLSMPWVGFFTSTFTTYWSSVLIPHIYSSLTVLMGTDSSTDSSTRSWAADWVWTGNNVNY
jgi:hypothetical protein